MPKIYSTAQDFQRELGKYNPIQTGGGIFETNYGGKYKLTAQGYEEIQAPQPPQLPDFSTLSPKLSELTTEDFSSLIKTSLPTIDTADLEKQMEERKTRTRGLISSEYERKIGEVREKGVAEQRAVGGQLGLGRRASTTAQGFLRYLQSENEKEITKYAQLRDEALAKADMDAANMFNERLKNAQQQAHQQFSDAMEILKVSLGETERGKVEAERLRAGERAEAGMLATGARALKDDARAQIDKMITQINQGTLDINTLDQTQIGELEENAGYYTGFLSSILAKPQKPYLSTFHFEDEKGDIRFYGLTQDKNLELIETLKGVGKGKEDKNKKDLADLLGQVASYATREEALTELNRYQSSIFEKVGQEGLDKIKVEVDRLFPEKKEEKIKKTGLFWSFFNRLFGK